MNQPAEDLLSDSALSEPVFPMEQRRQWLLPSVQVLLFALIFWQALLFMPHLLNADGDLPMHLAIGDSILATAQIPIHDVFSHTRAGALFFSHEWLSEVFFALAFRAAGLNGVAWLTATVLGLIYAALAYALRDAGVRALVALFAAYAASIVGAIHQLPRPHIFSALFLTLFLIVLERYRRTQNRRVLYFSLPVMLLWANMHGGFMFGLGLVGMYVLGAAFERDRTRVIELSACLVALVLVACINPNGGELIAHLLAWSGARYILDQTTEFKSPDLHALNTWPFFALLITSLALGWRAKPRLDWTHLILLAGWSAFALYSARLILFYAQVVFVVLAPVVDRLLDQALPKLGRIASNFEPAARLARGEIWGVAIAAVLIALEASGAKLDLWREGNVFESTKFPITAVNKLKDNLPNGKLFNDFTWGGYLMLRLYPRAKVFIDGRTDFYGEQLTRDYLQAVNGEAGWDKLMDQYDIRWVMLQPTQPLADRLDTSANWIPTYQDETAHVWVRK